MFLNNTITLIGGDSFEILKELPDNSIDSVMTDPPYALISISKRFGKMGRTDKTFSKCGPYQRHALGFMNKAWDNGSIAFNEDFWGEVWRVLKPGGHMCVFGGTRTFHRLVCSIEDGGFEIRDTIAWVFGQGFPKSHDVSKGIDKAAGKKRIIKTGVKSGHDNFVGRDNHPLNGGWDRPWASNPEAVDRYHSTFAPVTDTAKQWDGWGSALKPAMELVCLARKPLSEKTIAANVLRWGTGAINVDGCRVESGADYHELAVTQGGDQRGTKFLPSAGRWPANLCHDGSEEVLAGLPDLGASSGQDTSGKCRSGMFKDLADGIHHGDSGSAARFFYCAKASKQDRAGSKHPTIKPIKLIQWLVRLVTPPGGTVLDCFAGSGTTGTACYREGFKAILVEKEEEYLQDIRNRLDNIDKPMPRGQKQGGMVNFDHASRESIKKKRDVERYIGSDGKTRYKRDPRPNGIRMDKNADIHADISAFFAENI